MNILRHLSKFFIIACLTSVCCRNSPAESIRQYTTPFEWPTSTPEAQDLNIDRLDEAMIAAEDLGYVKSFLVICNGFLVKEKYFNNSSMYSSNVIHSVSKSFLSAFTGIALKKEDFSGLGLLYLRDGKLNGMQIVPEEWVRESLRYRYGGSSSWGAITEIGYGYLWWLGRMGGYSLFMALGHEQFIVVFPDLELIIAVNSQSTASWDIADTQERAVIQIMADYILPAVEGN